MIIKKAGGIFIITEGEEILYSTDDLLTAACIVRFVKAGRLEKSEYDLVVSAMETAGKRANNE